MGQRLVREYDIGRHLLLPGDLSPQGPQLLEQGLLGLGELRSGHRASTALLLLFHLSRVFLLSGHLHEDLLLPPQHLPGFLRQFHNGVLVVGGGEIAV